MLLNEAMKIERSRHLKAEPFEHTTTRAGDGNGDKAKQLKTQLGERALSVPQVRDSDFYPTCLERGRRSDRALLLSLAEMYVQGTSTRKVSKIVESFCGMTVNSIEVSRATQLELHPKKRRTRVATLFPNEASCCRLVTAVRMEISEEWASGRR